MISTWSCFSFLFPWVDDADGADGWREGSKVGVLKEIFFCFFLAGEPDPESYIK